MTRRVLVAALLAAAGISCTALVGDGNYYVTEDGAVSAGPDATVLPRDALAPDGELEAAAVADASGADRSMPYTAEAGPAPCPAATPAFCREVCVNEQTDDSNCGGCGVACSGGKTCQGGACVCPSGTHDCSGACASNASTSSCGGSCTPCPVAPANATATCNGVSCGYSCNPGYASCGGACVNVQTDANNCGTCGVGCASPATCQAGRCACSPGVVYCGGACVSASLTTSCGGCTPCSTSSGTPSCDGTTCSYGCKSGLLDCNASTAPDADGCEASITSLSSCGGCGNACDTSTGTPSCNGTTCTYACKAGRLDCNAATAPDVDGCESTVTSPSSCGGCGITCDSSTGTPSCNGSTCTYVCNPGLGDCNAGNSPDTDGCETSITASPNCGACGNACEDASSCTAHSNGFGQLFYDCNATGTYDQAAALEACLSSNHGPCTSVTSNCGSSSNPVMMTAVCAGCSGIQTEYCWEYSGTGAGQAFTTAALFGCSACPTGTMVSWN